MAHQETVMPDPPVPERRLTGRRLLWHSMLNFGGQAIPVAAGLIAVPLLLHGLGNERFAILTLVWSIIGYFGLLDLGLSRALTHLVAERRDSTSERELAGLVWAVLLAMLGVGLVGWVAAELVTTWLATSFLDITPELRPEAIRAFRTMALAIPVIVVTGGLRGVLEAYQRFDLVNAARVPLGAINYLGPVAVLAFDNSLVSIVVLLAIMRVVALVVHFVMCTTVMPSLRHGPNFRVRLPRELLRTGGWMTVSNLVTPLVVSADRFLIGALASTAVVAYYTAPYEVIARLMIIPASVANSLFPAFASPNDERTRATLYIRGLMMTCVALFPALITLLAFAPEILRWWLGPEFGVRSAGVLQLLAAGVYINCLAQIAFALVQGAGRSDLAAKLHLIEVPFYLVAAWLLIRWRGVEGAALAWSLRTAVDAIVLFLFARHIVPATGGSEFRPARRLLGLSVACTVLGVGLGTAALPQRAAFALVTTAVVLASAWFGVASMAERRRMLNLFARGGSA